MKVLQNIRQSLGSYLSPQTKQAGPKTDRKNDVQGNPDSPRLSMSDLSGAFEGDISPVPYTASKKRRISASETLGAKRRRLNNADHVGSEDSGMDESALLHPTTAAIMPKVPTQAAQAARDRVLMPPPSIHITNRRNGDTGHDRADDDSSGVGSSVPGDGRGRQMDGIDDFDMELARRNAEALDLPVNSGIWTADEKDLFHHLAMRGFEPLVPNNWMADFRTLPLSLFEREGYGPPIISAKLEPEFHAIRSLRDLWKVGQQVRDGAISLYNHQPQSEKTIQRAIQKYFAWALRDIGLHPIQRPSVIPVHAITAMKRGQTIENGVTQLTVKLHLLAARWRRAFNIHDSVEARSVSPISNDETQVLENNGDDLPILTGILIYSSLFMIVTLNAHTPPPASLRLRCRSNSQFDILSPQSLTAERDSPEEPEKSTQANATHTEVEDSGLRVIAQFDFSKSHEDVWNAFAIAIVAMCVRKIMASQFELASGGGRGAMFETVKPRRSLLSSDQLSDPDA